MARPLGLRISPVEKFGLSRNEAAAFVGLTLSSFDKLVINGEMPPARRLGGALIWVRIDLSALYSKRQSKNLYLTIASGRVSAPEEFRACVVRFMRRGEPIAYYTISCHRNHSSVALEIVT